MPIVQVPAGATPGVIDSSTLVAIDSVCDVGSRAGAADSSVSAWVQVCITPAGVVTPDAFGRFFHVCIEFAQPVDWIGKRRRQVPAWSTVANPSAMFVECDPGWFWIGTAARFHGTGGTAGDKYNVTMTTVTYQQQSDTRLRRDDPPFYQVDVFEPACHFQLTSLSLATHDAPSVPIIGMIPAHHSRFRVRVGTATWGGVTVTPISRALPLDAPITTGVNTIYQTGGAV